MFKIWTSNTFRQIYAIFVFTHGSFLLGVITGFPVCLIPQLEQERLILSTLTKSILASISQFVACFGAPFSVIFIGKTGRKRILRILLLWYAAGMGIVCISSDIPILCLGLTIASTIICFVLPVTVTYTSETCQQKNRGVLISGTFVFINVGNAVVYLLSTFLTWRMTALFSVGVALSGFLQTYFIPETKYWHLLTENKDRAVASLLWFEPNLSEADVERKMNAIYESINGDPNAKLGHFMELIKNLRYRKYFKPVLLGLIITFVQAGSNKMILEIYLMDILKKLIIPYPEITLSTIYGIVEIIGSIVILLFIHKCNRKNVIYISSGILIASSAFVVVYKLLHNRDIKVIPPWTVVCCMFTYSIITISALNSSLFVILSEIQHAYYRAEVTSFFSGTIFLIFSIYSFLFPYVEKMVAIEYVIMYFATNVIIAVIVIFFFFPETSKFEFFETIKNCRRKDCVAE